jgi:hypothetical protein
LDFDNFVQNNEFRRQLVSGDRYFKAGGLPSDLRCAVIDAVDDFSIKELLFLFHTLIKTKKLIVADGAGVALFGVISDSGKAFLLDLYIDQQKKTVSIQVCGIDRFTLLPPAKFD